MVPHKEWYYEDDQKLLKYDDHKVKLSLLCPNLVNLSRVSNPPKPDFNLSAGLNLEKFNTILSETNHIWAAAQILKIRPLV